MNIEQLTKSQIILLTLLVSFVTSIATGIVTVALMDQAPQTITQNISRIVERTVEKVAPQAQTASVAMSEKTVVVKESDLISKAVQRTRPSVASVYKTVEGVDAPTFAARGFALSPRYIATGAALVEKDRLYSIVLGDGTRAVAHVAYADPTTNVAFLAIDATGSTTPAANPADLSSDPITLGETLIALSGQSALTVAQGIVTSIAEEASSSVPNAPPTKSFGSSFSKAASQDVGSPVINIDGSVTGIIIADDGLVLPSQSILNTFKTKILATVATSTP